MSESLDIVVHAFSAELPQYAAMLKAQARAIADHAPDSLSIQLVIACTFPEQDPQTWITIQEIIPWMRNGFVVRVEALPREQLFRRAIFRHYWSQRSQADVLWFADCDYCPLQGCLSAICEQVSTSDGLCFPKTYYRHREHHLGDRSWQAIAKGDVLQINPLEFEVRKCRKAIGGMQIIGRDVVRRIGYLGKPQSRWQRPVGPEIPFGCFRDDSQWRRQEFPDGGRKIDVPNLYRQRHSRGAAGSPGPDRTRDNSHP
jgi:hypothetical protein